jgi:hypothetical protein
VFYDTVLGLYCVSEVCGDFITSKLAYIHMFLTRASWIPETLRGAQVGKCPHILAFVQIKKLQACYSEGIFLLQKQKHCFLMIKYVFMAEVSGNRKE